MRLERRKHRESCLVQSKRERPVSQEGWAAEDPEEVCCHSDQCGLFFFWLPLLHAGHVLGSGYHDKPTTPVSHIAEKESGSERRRDQTGRVGRWKKQKWRRSKFVLFWSWSLLMLTVFNMSQWIFCIPLSERAFVCFWMQMNVSDLLLSLCCNIGNILALLLLFFQHS